MYKIFIFNCYDCDIRTVVRVPNNIIIDTEVCIECLHKKYKIKNCINPLFIHKFKYYKFN